MAQNADVNIRLLADVSRAEQALRRVTGELNNMKSAASRGGGVFGAAFGGNGLQRQVSGIRSTMASAFRGGMSSVGSLTGGLVAGGLLGAPIAAGAFAINQAFQWQDAWMEVIKTVGRGAQDMGLDKTAMGMAKDMGFSPTEVAKTMAIGGQMNVPTAELADFTKVMLQASVATDMTAESAGQMSGQFVAAMRTADPDKWNKILSTTAQLADALPGGETRIMDTAQRFALSGKSLGLNESQVMGMAAFTQGVGIDPEMGGSSLSRLFLGLSEAGSSARGESIPDTKQVTAASDKLEDIDAAIAIANEQHSEFYTRRGKLKKGVSKSSLMAADENLRRLHRERGETADALGDAQHPGMKEAGVFASLAGMSTDEFGAGVKSDPFGTFRRVLGGLQQKDKEGTLIAALDPLGINNIRDVQTLLPLVQGLNGKDNMPGLDDVMSMAAGEYANPTRLQKEFDARQGSDSTKFRKAQAGLEVAGIEAGTVAAPLFVDAATKLVQGADELAQKLAGLTATPNVQVGGVTVNVNDLVNAPGPEQQKMVQQIAGAAAEQVKNEIVKAWDAVAARAKPGVDAVLAGDALLP